MGNLKRNNRIKHEGFSLAEALIATVILSVAAAGVLVPYTSGAAVRAEGMRRTLAAKLAADLMEEIVAQPFEQIVAAYDGYVEPQGQVKDASKVIFADSNYAKFSRGASCSYDAGQPFFIVVTVWVKYDGHTILNLSRLISK
ncbi:MAG TPA: prepilin-type N-terminal cleavage/methylation domain-containing protein [Sedimentisphaerales bacterium]|nr:prepilin-type N-terminal cleavage/methylation domain-containing protein [Sedimentisphaerales bacterium]